MEVFPPPFHRRAVSRFESKADLIECLLASAHIPVLLDYKPCASYKGKLCIDGSALKNNYVKNPDPGWDLPSTGTPNTHAHTHTPLCMIRTLSLSRY